MEWFRYNGMKLNSDKCNLPVCGHKFECMICKIENSHVIETHLVKLLDIKIQSELTFNNYMEAVCSRLCSIIPFQKRKILMHAFFHSRRINTKINNLHCRALHVIYLGDASSFEELLGRDDSFTIHQRNENILTENVSSNKRSNRVFIILLIQKQ